MAINNHAGINADTVLAAIAAGASDIVTLANHFGVSCVNRTLWQVIDDLSKAGGPVRVALSRDGLTFTSV